MHLYVYIIYIYDICYLPLLTIPNLKSLWTVPEPTIGILVLLDGARLVLDAVPCLPRRDEITVLDLDRMRDDLVEGIDVLQQTLVPGHAEIVDQGEVLRILVEADAAAVREDRDVEPAAVSTSYLLF